MSDQETVESEPQHNHEQGDVLVKVDGAEWKITNRMVDVDTGELVYRLRETKVGRFQETEIMSQSQVERSYNSKEETA